MPSADQILCGLQVIGTTWKSIAILWHIFFGVLAVLIAVGIPASGRFIGWMLALPFLSVSFFAWLTPNPVNGALYAIVGIALLLVTTRLTKARIQIATLGFLIPGLLLFIFGWIYPHFLDTSSILPYLYAAPIGTIPCPTLIIVIGTVLILDGLGSRRFCTILGVTGLLYGVMGAIYLHVMLDWVLVFGAVLVLIFSYMRRWIPTASESTASNHIQ